jgi:hypothetical protein
MSADTLNQTWVEWVRSHGLGVPPPVAPTKPKKTPSQLLAEAGFSRRLTARSLPSDE